MCVVYLRRSARTPSFQKVDTSLEWASHKFCQVQVMATGNLVWNVIIDYIAHRGAGAPAPAPDEAGVAVQWGIGERARQAEEKSAGRS